MISLPFCHFLLVRRGSAPSQGEDITKGMNSRRWGSWDHPEVCLPHTPAFTHAAVPSPGSLWQVPPILQIAAQMHPQLSLGRLSDCLFLLPRCYCSALSHLYPSRHCEILNSHCWFASFSLSRWEQNLLTSASPVPDAWWVPSKYL